MLQQAAHAGDSEVASALVIRCDMPGLRRPKAAQRVVGQEFKGGQYYNTTLSSRTEIGAELWFRQAQDVLDRAGTSKQGGAGGGRRQSLYLAVDLPQPNMANADVSSSPICSRFQDVHNWKAAVLWRQSTLERSARQN
ncbi:hypothetical protein C8J57DRAFT_1212310 [Mycena rebaudengoi]|nr:hypothetical protein C8J57DRAFT_1212310 [Mycena rebaudengoi]